MTYTFILLLLGAEITTPSMTELDCIRRVAGAQIEAAQYGRPLIRAGCVKEE